MRDIRPELRERLNEITTRRRELMTEFNDLEAAENATKQMLRIEESRFSKQAAKTEVKASGTESLPQFLLSIMPPGQVRDHATLKARAIEAGVVEADKAGRAVQGALMVLKNSRKIERVEKGRWTLASKREAPPGSPGGAS